MMNLNDPTLAAMVRTYPSGAWDVLHGCDTPPDLPVCMTYHTLQVALDALMTAGFSSTRYGVPAPGLDGPYDLTTCLRFADRHGHGVVLVRCR